MAEPLHLRLQRALSIISRADDPGAADAQSACGKVAARIVVWKTRCALLANKEGAAEQEGAGH